MLETLETTELDRETAIPVTPTIVMGDDFTDRPTNLSFRFLILLISGGTWYAAVFLWLPMLAIGAGLTCGAVAYSIRQQGETLFSVSAEFLIDTLHLGQDCLDGFSDTLQNKALPVIRHNAQTMARFSGLLSKTELQAIEERGGGEVSIPLSVIELIVGTPKAPHNTALLAPSQSGKTTLLHGVVHHLLGLSQPNIVLVGDPNYGAANDGTMPVWGGLPLYRRELTPSPIAHHQLIIGKDDIYSALDQLGNLYIQRMDAAGKRAVELHGSDDLTPMGFTPIYFFVDEFQTFIGELGEGQVDRVNEVFGQLIRAAKYRIYFYPVLHNDRAEGGINTSNLGGVNLLLMGSVIDQIGTSKLLNNSRKRFDAAFLAKLANYRSTYNARYGKSKSQKMLGAIDLTKGFTASNGDDFAPGCHVLKIPNCTDRVNIRHDFTAIAPVITTADPVGEAVVAADDDLEVPAIVVEMGEEFGEWFVEHFPLFQSETDWSLTQFANVAIANGWGRRRKPTDKHYAFLQALVKAQGGRIKPVEVLDLLQGGE
jgi:hypothetical protein